MPTSLTPQQRRVLAAFLRRSNRQGATPVERKALVEAGLVEANLGNPAYGDRDSIGSLQERSGYGSVGRRLDPSLAAKRFLTEARQLKRPGISAGELAQAVQRSGFPARYGQRGGEADALLSGYRSPSSKTSPPTSTSRTTPGVDRSSERRALILNWLQTKGRPGALTALATGLQGSQDTPGRTVTVTRHAGSTPSSQHGSLASFDGKQVSAWMKPVLEYARSRGWKGTVTSGHRSDAEQAAIYQRGTRPAAVPKSLGGAGSKHEQTGFLQGAVDVTDAATLSRILKAKHSRLQWAGVKDPPHFSVPSGGSY